MVGFALLLAALQFQGDTVHLDVATAFSNALEASPVWAAARERASAAGHAAAQAGGWPNPGLTVAAENVGREFEVTGFSGAEGLEGQAVLTTALPFGWERSGTVLTARARASASQAEARVAQFSEADEALGAIGAALRDRTLRDNAVDELQTLTRIATALAMQADAGRASTGDAARARLAQGMAATALARREAQMANSATDLARRLELPVDTWVEMTVPRCTPSGARDPALPTPEVDAAGARAVAAQAGVTLARGVQLPDLTPQVGLRRVGGMNALYLGVTTFLPLFDRGTERVEAARATQRAAEHEASATVSVISARLEAATQALAALDRAGAGFTDEWFAALEQAITATTAAYDLGEATLFELLDSRRARLQALDDYAVWQAEWWRARAELSRLEGRVPAPELLCADPYREGPR